MYKLYEYPGSGNCYKIRLLLNLLGVPFEAVTVDIMAGESRSEAFRAMNPAGKVPVLELAPGDYLPESNAALWYLAEGTRYLPEDRRPRAEVLRWMFFEQYSHEPNIAVARFWVRYLGNPPELARRLARRREAGRQALALMDAHLESRQFLVGDGCTIADLALYAYTHVAPEGGFDLGTWPAVVAWLRRVAAQPGYVPMET